MILTVILHPEHVDRGLSASSAHLRNHNSMWNPHSVPGIGVAVPPTGANSVPARRQSQYRPTKEAMAGHHTSETSSKAKNQSIETARSYEPKATPDPEPSNQDIEHQSTLSRQITPQFTQERQETEIQDAVERVARKSIYPQTVPQTHRTGP